MEVEASTSSVADEAKHHLQDFSRVVIFDHTGRLLYSTCKVLPSDMAMLTACFGDRDSAMQQGLRLEGKRYEVTRHHPPLVWGRNMADSEPELSTGIAVCRIEPSRAGEPGGPCYLAATFEQPHTAAQAVPRLEEFAEKHLKAKA